jgi:hypothetical protein
VSGYNRFVGAVDNGSESTEQMLTAAQRQWVLHNEELWRRARAIVETRPDLDAGDVHHALRALELPPSERLRRGLTRVRARPHAR